ncbi:hypothetical protein [Wenxinia saemankumensis]|uniref:Uncharacterized protein n=1 Tax=Wenxinia saemankumensis TaxID=1447782 RepID=A0A1M6EYS2_9RHOB|nr:hypothetical protein [Wenxinia saemankumensis]SHI90565.1 hypothetical protein SAMN05444417_2252 [Wenxinia saemankumensis]
MCIAPDTDEMRVILTAHNALTFPPVGIDPARDRLAHARAILADIAHHPREMAVWAAAWAMQHETTYAAQLEAKATLALLMRDAA